MLPILRIARITQSSSTPDDCIVLFHGPRGRANVRIAESSLAHLLGRDQLNCLKSKSTNSCCVADLAVAVTSKEVPKDVATPAPILTEQSCKRELGKRLAKIESNQHMGGKRPKGITDMNGSKEKECLYEDPQAGTGCAVGEHNSKETIIVETQASDEKSMSLSGQLTADQNCSTIQLSCNLHKRVEVISPVTVENSVFGVSKNQSVGSDVDETPTFIESAAKATSEPDLGCNMYIDGFPKVDQNLGISSVPNCSSAPSIDEGVALKCSKSEMYQKVQVDTAVSVSREKDNSEQVASLSISTSPAIPSPTMPGSTGAATSPLNPGIETDQARSSNERFLLANPGHSMELPEPSAEHARRRKAKCTSSSMIFSKDPPFTMAASESKPSEKIAEDSQNRLAMLASSEASFIAPADSDCLKSVQSFHDERLLLGAIGCSEAGINFDIFHEPCRDIPTLKDTITAPGPLTGQIQTRAVSSSRTELGKQIDSDTFYAKSLHDDCSTHKENHDCSSESKQKGEVSYACGSGPAGPAVVLSTGAAPGSCTAAAGVLDAGIQYEFATLHASDWQSKTNNNGKSATYFTETIPGFG